MPLLMIARETAPPSITALTNGGFAVAWNGYDGLTGTTGSEVQLFDPNGAPIDASFQVGTRSFQLGRTGSGSPGVQTPAIAALANGGFVVSGNYDSGLFAITLEAQIFDANGTKVGNDIVVAPNNSDGNPPAVAGLADGNFVVVWHPWDLPTIHAPVGIPAVEERPEPVGQIFDPQGNKIGSEFAVNSAPYFWHASNAGVAALPNGGFVVTWEEQRSDNATVTDVIEAQQFDASGTKTGPQFHIDAKAASVDAFVAYQPKVTALADGSFAVIWQDGGGTDGNSSGSVVKAQVFDAYQQSPIGDEVQLNVQTSGGQAQPQIVGLQDGGFVIAWGEANGEKAQIYATGPAVTTIAARATLDIPSASTAEFAFAPGVAALQFDNPAAFAGSITGFGTGDSIDLADIAFSSTGTTLGYSANANNSGGHLVLSDGTHIAALTLLGQYVATSFVLSAGGTVITAAAPDTAGQLYLAAPV
jgi:hypothetical protein